MSPFTFTPHMLHLPGLSPGFGRKFSDICNFRRLLGCGILNYFVMRIAFDMIDKGETVPHVLATHGTAEVLAFQVIKLFHSILRRTPILLDFLPVILTAFICIKTLTP